MSYKVTYNGVSSEDVGVIMYDLPEIALAKRNYNTYSIPGRNGELIGSDTYLSNVKVSCTFSVLSDNFMEVIRNIRKWLKGTGKLYLSDNSKSFYEVLAIDYGNIERILSRYGQFSVDFTCYPYEFADSGQQEYSVQDVSRNIYDTCMPLYKIHGNGECTLKVNNYDFVANVSKVLNIDSRLMICYDADKNYRNTSVLGDYEKLWLQNGQNIITITNGFSLMVEPRWGYSL